MHYIQIYRVNEFRWLLSQFSTIFFEILYTLLFCLVLRRQSWKLREGLVSSSEVRLFNIILSSYAQYFQYMNLSALLLVIKGLATTKQVMNLFLFI